MKLSWNLPVYALGAVALTGCHGHVGQTQERARQFSGVTLQDVTFHSAALGRDVTYRVYLPARIETGERLPVVYLLHGAWENYRSWSDYSDAGALAAKGMVLVMPDGALSYWVNAAGAPEDKYGDFLLNDLRSDVERRFPAKSDRAARAVVGVSMGGFAAVEYALRRPELFSFAAALSPAIDAPERRFSWRRLEQSIRLRKVFGPDGSQERRNEDPFNLVQMADPGKTPYLYITAGEQEALLGPIRRFAGQLDRRGFTHEFNTAPGGHGWGTWNRQTSGCFDVMMKVIVR
ncbi:MAG TPA: alpha/beta hydrolase-fold protein [Terracidiphilus sp.]|nr:alpha/beta hydrolase-fold protein [Terracidiphilus sp.]